MSAATLPGLVDALLLLDLRPMTSERSLCDLCGTRPPRNRWGAPLPKKFPDTLSPEHIEDTLRMHPWLGGTRLAALIETLRDNEVMGA